MESVLENGQLQYLLDKNMDGTTFDTDQPATPDTDQPPRDQTQPSQDDSETDADDMASDPPQPLADPIGPRTDPEEGDHTNRADLEQPGNRG